MAGRREKLNRNQQRAITALLASPSVEAAAAAAGIGARTLFRWLTLVEFQEAYKAARKELVVQVVAKIQNAMTLAVDTLVSVMSDPEAPPSSRVAAAKCVLFLGVKVSQLEDVEARLAAIEKRIEGGKL